MGLAKNSLWTFLSKGAVFVLRFPIGIMTARFLGPEGKGFLYLITASVVMGAALGNLGLGPASIYFIGKDQKRLPTILGNLLLVTGVVSVIIGGVGWLFLSYGRPDIYAQLPLWMWGIVAVLIAIQLLESFLTQVLSAVLRIKEINVMEIAVITTNLLLFILFVVMMEEGIEGAFLAYAFSIALSASGLFFLVLRYGGRPTRPNIALLRASLRFGVKSYLSNMMRRLNLRLDAFLVASLAIGGINATGVYSVATNLAELVLFIPESIRLSLFPMVAAGSSAEANRLTSMACRHTMFLTMLVALGFAIFGPFLIPWLYGADFTEAVIPLLILLPGVMLLSQARIFYSDLSGRGRPGTNTISALTALIATIVLDLILIPRYGVIGAAMASTCAYTLDFLVAGSFFIRYSGLTWTDVLIVRQSDLRHYSKISPLTVTR